MLDQLMPTENRTMTVTGATIVTHPRVKGYAYEPVHEDDSYAYVPDNSYTGDSYGPAVTYRYETTETFRHAPRNHASGVRTTRSYTYGDISEVINRNHGRRAAVVHRAEVRDRTGMRNVSAVGTERESVTSRRSAVGTERESATSRRVRSEEASRAMAREPDSRQSKGLETGRARAGYGRTQY